jgi:signal transduction histidine kinase
MAAVGEMASAVAHNIRNPLAGIRATAQSAMRDLPARSPLAQQQHNIVHTIDSFDRWLRDFLRASQPIELNLEPTSVSELIERLVRVFQPSADQKKLRIRCDADQTGPVNMDSRRVEQALAALLDNAIEVSPPAAEIHITAHQDQQHNLTMSILDQGPGVPPAYQDRLFAPRFTTKSSGLGMGLFLAKKVIDAHGGTLSLEQGEQSGTMARIRLPADTTWRKHGANSDSR